VDLDIEASFPPASLSTFSTEQSDATDCVAMVCDRMARLGSGRHQYTPTPEVSVGGVN